VDEKLIDLLSSLVPDEWDLPTVAAPWTCRDVAAHLLDTPLRKLSLARDSCFVEPVHIQSPQDLIDLVNRLNREGVAVYRRLSAPVLIDLMKLACDQAARYHESLDPFDPALFRVSWAGEGVSPNWFDTARELTEHWHHQQQIRFATNRPGIMTPELYHPVLDCFLRGLPHAYRHVEAEDGTTVMLEVSGECGGKWFLVKEPSQWTFGSPSDKNLAATVTIPQEIAWRVFTKGIGRSDALAQSDVSGSQELGVRVFDLTAIIA
jgi:uncharacterized protein (TIGR03083 family)